MESLITQTLKNAYTYVPSDVQRYFPKKNNREHMILNQSTYYQPIKGFWRWYSLYFSITELQCLDPRAFLKNYLTTPCTWTILLLSYSRKKKRELSHFNWFSPYPWDTINRSNLHIFPKGNKQDHMCKQTRTGNFFFPWRTANSSMIDRKSPMSLTE